MVKPALSFVTPYHYLFYRYLLAAPISIPILVYLLHKYRPHLKTILTIVGMELVAVTGALSFLYLGLSRTSAIEAQLITNTTPVFIILGGIFFLKEKEDKNEFTGLIIAIIGMLLLTLEPLISGKNGLAGLSFTGNVIVLGHNLLWALYVLLAKKLYRGVPKLLIGFISLWVGLVSFYALTLWTNPELHNPHLLFNTLSHPQVFIASLYMGIFGSIIAVPAYIYGNDRIEASEASLFSYLQPLITIPLAILLLKEQINATIVVALVLISLGVITAEHRPKLAKSPKP